MAIVVSFSSTKGGVGKSSLCTNLAGALTTREKHLSQPSSKVLLVDLDSHGSASHHLARKFSHFQGTIAHLLQQRASLSETIHHHSPLLHFIPCDRSFSQYTQFGQRNFTAELQDVLVRVKDLYDFIFLDVPPTLSTFTLIPLFLSDYVLIPVSALSGELSIHGVTEQLEVVKMVQQEDNPQLKLLGIVVTMVGKTRLSREVIQHMQKHHGKVLFKSTIPQSAKLAECSSLGTTIFSYGKTSPAAKAFVALGEEFLSRMEKRKEKK